VNTRGDCCSDDRLDRTSDRSSNSFAYRRRYANYINQKYALILGSRQP